MRLFFAGLMLVGLATSGAFGQVRRFSPFSAEADSPVWLDVGAEAMAPYVFRGVRMNGRGATARLGGEMGCVLYQDNDPPFTGLALTAGVAELAGTAGPFEGARGGRRGRWGSETDLTAGVTFNLYRALDVDAGYNAYWIPRAGDDLVQEVYGRLSLDDAELWTGRRIGSLGLFEWNFSVRPSLKIAREVGGSRFGGRSGTFVAVGAEPSIRVGRDVWLALPNGAAFGVDRYYGGADSGPRFGYAWVGPDVRVSVGANVEVGAGIEVDFLGDAARRAGGSGEILLVGRAGVVVRF